MSYQFVGDNVDRTRSRNQTLTNLDKDEHMFQIAAYQNQINGGVTGIDKGKAIKTVHFSDLLPSDTDKNQLLESIVHLVAEIWIEHLYAFHDAYLPNCAPHTHSKESNRSQTEWV